MYKYFTLEEANKALALVRPIVQDIQSKWYKAREIKDECDKLMKEEIINIDDELEEKEEQIDELLDEIEGHIGELHDIGCEFKGFEEGLVDFPIKVGGRPKFLCWKVSEESVCHWHEVYEGFTKRKEVGEVFLRALQTDTAIQPELPA